MHCGSRQNLSKATLRVLDYTVKLTQDNGPNVLNFVFNYGSKAELLDVTRKLTAQGFPPEQITEDTIAENLYTAGLPDVDLVIRTGGDNRISNFLLWQSAYADFCIVDPYWPSVGREEIEGAITYYNRKM